VLLRRGYTGESFVPGALVASMRNGALLHIDEANRLPPDSVNALISAMSERLIEVPRHGRVWAAPGFVVIAAANPLDGAGTADLPAAFLDRVVRLSLDHQAAAEERASCAVTARMRREAWPSGRSRSPGPRAFIPTCGAAHRCERPSTRWP